MKLYSLLKNINCRVFGSTILDITGLYHIDTEVKKNGLFFCLRGTRVDGKDFVLSAIKNGAVAIVTEQEIAGLSNITQIIVKNARETMSLIACKFFGNPAEKLKIIGVTGTNGKTSVTNMIASVLNNFGKKCAVVGTNGVYIEKHHYETSLTTPDPIDLKKFFSFMVKNNVEYVCMEVSAHAISQSKIEGIIFSQIIFTNLSQDHLDYFKNMENYYLAKAKLFSRKYTKMAIINFDDEYGERLSKCINITNFGYAINSLSDLTAIKIEQNNLHKTFYIDDKKVEINLVGKFNVYNVLATILCLEKLGFERSEIISKVKEIKPVDGRFNTYNIDEKRIVIDYAHTPDGLKNVLITCRELLNKNNKLISVFGCGGNRDTKKRKIMGEISSKYADFTFITSDNPRFEKKETIATEIKEGFINEKFKVVLDRKKAIKEAMEFAKKDDIILISGKGSENYIDEMGEKIPYSDKTEIEKYRR